MGEAQRIAGNAELRYAAAQSQLDAFGISEPTTTLPTAPSLRIASGPASATLAAFPAVHEETEGEYWFSVSAETFDGRPGYRFSNAGWLVLPDGTPLPPNGWQRSGDYFVQRSTGYALDQSGHLELSPPGLLESGDGNYALTGDLFGLYLNPAGGSDSSSAPGRHIPLIVQPEPQS
jgi:hypothetical protein